MCTIKNTTTNTKCATLSTALSGGSAKYGRKIKIIEEETNSPTVTPDTQPTEITLTMSEDEFKGMKYQEAEKKFREMGFTNFEYRTVDTENESAVKGRLVVSFLMQFEENFSPGEACVETTRLMEDTSVYAA